MGITPPSESLGLLCGVSPQGAVSGRTCSPGWGTGLTCTAPGGLCISLESQVCRPQPGNAGWPRTQHLWSREQVIRVAGGCPCWSPRATHSPALSERQQRPGQGARDSDSLPPEERGNQCWSQAPPGGLWKGHGLCRVGLMAGWTKAEYEGTMAEQSSGTSQHLDLSTSGASSLTSIFSKTWRYESKEPEGLQG